MVLGARPGLFADVFFKAQQMSQNRQRLGLERDRLKFAQDQLQSRQGQQGAKEARLVEQDRIKAEQDRNQLKILFGRQLQDARNSGDTQKVNTLIELGNRQGFGEDIGLPTGTEGGELTAPFSVESGVGAAGLAPLGVGPAVTAGIGAAQAAGLGPAQGQAELNQGEQIDDAITRALATAPIPDEKQNQLTQASRLINEAVARGSMTEDEGRRRLRLAAQQIGAPKTPLVQNIIGGDAQGLTKAQTSKAQGEVRKARVNLRMITEGRKALEAAGGAGVIANKLEQGADALGAFFSTIPVLEKAVSGERREKITLRTNVDSVVWDLSNAVISQRGGANVPEAEFKRLTRSLPIVGEPAEIFMAKFNAWERNFKIIEEEGINALFQGLGKANGARWEQNSQDLFKVQAKHHQNQARSADVAEIMQNIIDENRAKGLPEMTDEQVIEEMDARGLVD